jgi:hypothetical protein
MFIEVVTCFHLKGVYSRLIRVIVKNPVFILIVVKFFASAGFYMVPTIIYRLSIRFGGRYIYSGPEVLIQIKWPPWPLPDGIII